MGIRRGRFLAFALALLVVNNLSILWTAGLALDLGRLAMGAIVLAWAVGVEKLTPADLGFNLVRLRRSLGWGPLAGVGMATPALAFFAFPLVVAQPVQYAGYAGVDLGGFLAILLVRLPLSTVLVEETLFRGLIQEQGRRWLGTGGGIALTCVLFILWHVVITYQALVQTNLTASPVPVPVLYALAAIPLGAAGVIFSLLRHHTGSLTAPILAHWVVNTCMLVFLTVQPIGAG